jgi:hypothetical protein
MPVRRVAQRLGGQRPYLADFRPQQHSDAYSGVIEDARREHPGDPQITAAYAIGKTVRLFRQAWQCLGCGRLLVLGPDRCYYAFAPESPATPRDVLEGGIA